MLRFCDELIARVTRAGATGVKLPRADSGFRNNRVFERLEQAGWRYSIGVRMTKHLRRAVEQIDEQVWQTIECPYEGEAQIAETAYGGRRPVSHCAGCLRSIEGTKSWSTRLRAPCVRPDPARSVG
jgi:hypothetical protein